MAPLPSDLRRELEKAVVRARDVAEAGAANALVYLGVEQREAPSGLGQHERDLRVALRAHARALGREVAPMGMDELREEIAYGQWHRMLFARFLAENGLLVEPKSGAPVSMADVAELARDAGESDPWLVAARFAAEMLPGIFGTEEPTTQVAFAPDDRLRLEQILTGLPVAVFTSDDALGWVYQFWQAKRKKEVNARGDKIGGADLAPVTQLFTEHYMVRFLLENSLGAWWAARHPDSPLLREWEYLRFRDDGTPAAGTFEGWPDRAAEVTVMDPCCGSGHFLVAAADMLRKMRMAEEGLTAAQAAEAVLRDNLFGLELDPRCTQIAAFALAFDAWKTIGRYRKLPVPNLACSGIAIKGQLEDWRKLARGDELMAAALERLYDLFVDAPELGSLIDPRAAAGEGLWAVDPDRLIEKLEQALSRERAIDPAAAVFGSAAAGTAKAAQLLAGRYWLVATNPPFLGRGDQAGILADYVQGQFYSSRGDLATAIVARFLKYGIPGCVATVSPQAWLYQARYEQLRRELLTQHWIRLVARLGPNAFETISGEKVNVALAVVGGRTINDPTIAGIDAQSEPTPARKARELSIGRLVTVLQRMQLERPIAAISLDQRRAGDLLGSYSDAWQGIATSDYPRFGRTFWELPRVSGGWRLQQSTPETPGLFTGRQWALYWEDGYGRITEVCQAGATFRGAGAWNRSGVVVSQMNRVATLYTGEIFDNNVAILTPHDVDNVPALWCYVTSPQFESEVRSVEANLKVNNAAFRRLPFDLEHWQKVAAEQYPDGLPEPHSDDPTQWLFKGHPKGSEGPLQVALARLLGYRWPDQGPDELDGLADPDGIVCLPSIGGDPPAAERLERLLQAAFGADWTPALRAQLIAEAGSPGATLETWLRDDFFAQHARLFHNRPFIWHVWDGRRDGFSALLHYHRLDHSTLQKLTYTHLGDWLERQRAAVGAGEPGADARVAAAADLQRKLGLILEGEPPYDIYVRWKSLAEQPLGWQPDLDDGIRLNIRPFVEAGVLRSRFTIHWNKDRGRNPDGSERHNDCHHTLAEKRAAREAVG